MNQQPRPSGASRTRKRAIRCRRATSTTRRSFSRRRAKIFFKSWHLVAHVNELREPRLVRDPRYLRAERHRGRGPRRRDPRAFHNVCQHRGNRLVGARRGKTPTFTCGYHAWTYALDGCLRGAPNAQGVPGFNKSEHGLKPVRVEIFASFVFVNLDPQAQAHRRDGARRGSRDPPLHSGSRSADADRGGRRAGRRQLEGDPGKLDRGLSLRLLGSGAQTARAAHRFRRLHA